MSDWAFLNGCRVRHGMMGTDSSDGFNGMFEFAISGVPNRIRVIASDGMGWKHVSVSLRGSNKPPSWDLMCKIKDLFWDDEDAVVQFHPPKSRYVNNHPGCLHLWQSTEAAQPLPDEIMVGLKGLSQKQILALSERGDVAGVGGLIQPSGLEFASRSVADALNPSADKTAQGTNL